MRIRMARVPMTGIPRRASPPASAPIVHRDCNPARSTRRVLKVFEGEGYYLLLSGIYGGRSGSY